MAKKQKLSRDEQEKAEMEKMQKRVENLLPPKAEIPAPISIQQAEELKARITELEVKLAEQQISHVNVAPIKKPEKTQPPVKTKKRGFLSAPVFENEEENRNSYLLNFITIAYFIVYVSTTLIGLTRTQDLQQSLFHDIPQTLLPFVVTVIIAQVILRSGRVKLATLIFGLMLWLSQTYTIYITGGAASYSLFNYVLAIMAFGLLLGRRYSITTAIVSVVTAIVFLIMGSRGLLPENSITSNDIASVGFFTFFVTVFLSTSLLYLYLRQLDESVQKLQDANLALEESGELLEQRVADRTHDLELASEVGSTIAEKVENITAMLTDATEMIRARFNLYYTQVYLLDPSGQTITLHAGTGSAGRQLIQRGHHLLVSSSSLNGRAVSEKKPVIVADTAKNDSFLPNPLLPNTRSEMAIPLLVGDKVLGVLDMQSEFANALNEDNVAAFQVLAGQLSVAIQNATLFAQSEEARKQVEANARQIATVGWQDFLNGTDRGEKIGYVFDQTEVKPLERKNKAKSDNALSIPITVTGATVGTIQVAQDEREWTASETLIVQSTADQLAQHIENLRLLSQAEKYRQEAEQTTRRLTREGWEGYLQTRTALAEGYSFSPNDVKVENEDLDIESPTLSLPITVRDEAIGELTINADSVEPDAVNEIFSAVVAQLGDHIENLRLSEQNEKRAYELATVATVSTTASTVLDPDKLLQAVVNLTKERFNLYHAHIYLADESWNTLLLAAGAGEVGRQMVTEGWAIPIDHRQSIVANAARNRQYVIANNMSRDMHTGFLSNYLLPNTRSEMAVPMIVGEKLLGVFDVQADEVGHFTEEDVNIYTTLASQVAVALQNARLYVEQAATVTQLRELDRLKSSFLANMSHELRTPLNSILGFADVMLEGLDGPLTENMNSDLGLIQKNGQHLLHLINDVLDMAKIDSGKMNLHVEKFNIHDLFTDVTSITSSLAKDKSLALVIDAGSDREVEINADKIRLRQVMINLVNNAMKFTEKGQITICAHREENNILISVKDTGIGIPADHLELVFQEFTQVDTTTTRKAGGTGLGLPISRRLISMHSGRLWAESSGIHGEGSTFYVHLPIEANINENVTLTAN